MADEHELEHFRQQWKADIASQTNPFTLYGQAVTAEREGRLNDALSAYRKAFRLDQDIDKKFHHLQIADPPPAQPVAVDDDSFVFQRTLQTEPDYVAPVTPNDRHSTAFIKSSLLKSVHDNPFDPSSNPPHTQTHLVHSPEFHPLDTSKSIPINILPPELLSYILQHLLAPSPHTHAHDIASLESFALVSRKTRLLTLDHNLWRPLVESIFLHSSQGILKDHLWSTALNLRAIEEYARKKYTLDWRRFYIEQPRIRTDGCYISIISYLRRGQADNAFYDPTHICTYYRYIRFLPDGTCLSLLSTHPPSEIVRTFDRSFRAKGSGLSLGHWSLQNDQVILRALDPLDEERGDVQRRYTFRMTVKLKSTSRGKMNKLELLSLCTENRISRELIETLQKSDKPTVFYFSRVRAYD